MLFFEINLMWAWHVYVTARVDRIAAIRQMLMLAAVLRKFVMRVS